MDAPGETETVEQMQARHRREAKELQGRITSKKKNASKKTRKGVNDECEGMERDMRQRQADELAALQASPSDGSSSLSDNEEPPSRVERMENKVEETLEKAVHKLHLGSPPTDTANDGSKSIDGSKANADDPSQGKKRNRQRERLARRAAEQEAAAARAEEEASTMTDDRARESEYMDKMFATYDLSEKEIAPDGHCLFSAVADQLAQEGVPLSDSQDKDKTRDEPHKTVRRAAAAYMLAHADDFAPFLEGDLGAYAAQIRDTAEWGGQLELMALARLYNVEIRVVQDGRTEKIGEREGDDSGRVLWLAYYRHGYGLGEHYNSLRRK